MNIMQMRRGMGASGAPLPYDSEIEYLESTGGQWINTGYIINSQSKIICNYKVVSAVSPLTFGVYPFGSRIAWQNKMYGIISPVNTIQQVQILWGNTNYYSQNLNIIGVDITGIIDIPNKFGQIATLSHTFADQTFASNNLPLYLFALNNNTEAASAPNIELIIYSFKVEENGVVVLDFIPVRVGQIGYMYDKVSRQLFGNAGTGLFGLGPDK